MTRSRIPSHDRRTHSRIQTHLPCEIRCGPDTARGTLLDASLGGMLVLSSRGWLEGTELTVTLEIPGPGKKVSLCGRVIRVTRPTSAGEGSHQLGLRFGKIIPESMMLLQALLAAKKAT